MVEDVYVEVHFNNSIFIEKKIFSHSYLEKFNPNS